RNDRRIGRSSNAKLKSGNHQWIQHSVQHDSQKNNSQRSAAVSQCAQHRADEVAAEYEQNAEKMYFQINGCLFEDARRRAEPAQNRFRSEKTDCAKQSGKHEENDCKRVQITPQPFFILPSFLLRKNRQRRTVHPKDERQDREYDRAGNSNRSQRIGAGQIANPKTVNELIRYLQQIRKHKLNRKINHLFPYVALRKIVLTHPCFSLLKSLSICHPFSWLILP